jgi:Holliday junction DNA helicase RuvA
MISFLKGIIVEKKPTELLIDCNSVGYSVSISVNTFQNLPEIGQITLIHTVLIPKEDSWNLFGFFDKSEREVFNLLITVNGIGPKSAISILSSISATELAEIINNNNPRQLQKIPGIGQKTAERITLELKDKIRKSDVISGISSDVLGEMAVKAEAIEALIVLGYNRNIAEKTIAEIIKSNKSNLTNEEIIKLALQKLLK